MNVIAEAWGQINEFRSVLVRLREFEGKIYQHTPAAQRRRGDNTPHCWLLPPDSGAPIRPRRWWQRCLPRRSSPQWNQAAAPVEASAPAPSGDGAVVVHELAPTYGSCFDEGRASGSLYPERL